MSEYEPSPHRYWADEEPDKIGPAVARRWRQYQEAVEEEGRRDIWRIADLSFHGRNPDGSYANGQAITFGGEEGELAKIHIGVARRHIMGRVGLATSQRPAFEVSAISNDPGAIASTEVGREVLEHDLAHEGLEEDLVDAHVRAELYSEGYLVQTWDPHLGRIAGVDEIPGPAAETSAPGLPEDAKPEIMDEEAAELGLPGTGVSYVVREGDVRIDVRSPLDVARDLDLDRCDEQPWYIVRRRVHKWELAARYPDRDDIRQAIIEAPGAPDDEFQLHRFGRAGTTSGRESDYVHVLTLYHMSTDALPQGRIVDVVDETALPGDGPYTYDHCVVHRDIPTAELDRAVGYADTWDLLAPQQALDAQVSSMLTVADIGSIINWVARRGQKVDTRMLGRSLQLVEIDDEGIGADPPTVMDRAENRESDFKMVELWQSIMRVISAQNEVVQGDPGSNIKAGNFAALIASMAVNAVSMGVASYARLFRSVLGARLSIYKTFAEEPRLIRITGKDKAQHVRKFRGADLAGTSGVTVELGSPLMRTIHGKTEIASQMLARYGPDVIGPQQFMTLLFTGRLDDIDSGSVLKHRVLAREENDLFRAGRTADQVMVHMGQHHACHIAEHLDEIESLNLQMVRGEAGDGVDASAALEAMLQHVFGHVQAWPNTPPEILAATGQSPAPSTLMGPPGGGGGGAPGGPGAAIPPPPSADPTAGGQPPALPMADGQEPIQAAQPPANPLTGAPVPAGGVQ